MRIVFMGTPDFAARILQAVAGWAGGEVVAVYAQPDRPAGRGNKLKAPAVKVQAAALGIPVFQPLNFKADEDVQTLRDLAPDVLVVAAYGLLLPQRVLDIPTLGPYNVHASLLPKYRGAAPIQRSLMHGDKVTGVTIMRMEAGLDTGPVLLQQALSIEPNDNSGSMFEILAEYGSNLMVGALGMLAENRAAFIPQNHDEATYAAKITRQEEWIDWSRSAEEIHNHIRGLSPVPGARSVLNAPAQEPVVMQVEAGEVQATAQELTGQPGTVVGYDGKALVVACGEGYYSLTNVRPAGKKSMSATAFVNGRQPKTASSGTEPRYPVGAVFSSRPEHCPAHC